MAEQQSPQAPTEWQTRRSKLAWRSLLIFNLAIGAYIFARPKTKETTSGAKHHHRRASEKDEVKEVKAEEEVPTPPTESTLIHDFDYDHYYDMASIYGSETIPHSTEHVKVQESIPEDQQRDLFMWMLEEKRKLKPRNPEEKKRIDEDKAVIKQFIRAKSIPRF